MSETLTVYCDSINSVVEMKAGSVLLTTLTWNVHDKSPGFLMENADFLVNVYFADFFVLNENAVVQFIMSVAKKIMNDQQLGGVVYLSSDGDASKYPMFLPYTIDDESIPVLPHQQLSLCEIWGVFQRQLDGFVSLEFLDELVPDPLREGFMDLVNAELSLLRKEEA